MKQKSVLISGAGIAGPALARWLEHRGFEPVLIERAAQFREGGYMIDFSGVGYDVAERMNLIPQLRDTVTSSTVSNSWMNADGRRADSMPGCYDGHLAIVSSASHGALWHWDCSCAIWSCGAS
jgi:2-polyprenyl-6-methoxyphenol hydroxylase-like FAD-dependent oxidoreductase